MSCILRIIGENFDIDRSLLTIAIQPYNIWHKGDPLYKTKPEGKKLTHNGCTFIASKAEFNQFDQQAADAIAFLKDNRQDLQTLIKTVGIENAWLDFGVGYDEYKFVQSKHLPIDLIKLCAELDISIELSIYAPASDE